MKFSEKWGKNVDEAVDLALKDLGVDKDQVEITILEEPSRGFLGLGSKLAKIRAEVVEVKKEKVAEKKPEAPKEERVKEVKKTRQEPARKEKGESIVFTDTDNLTEVEEHAALDFLKETTDKMGLSLTFKAKEGDNNIYIEIEGKDAGAIIGKRGQTLDAIQYLTSLVVNKEKEKYKRVIVDAENYREKRERILEQLAIRLSEKVKKTKRSVRLEPMNPYERKVIHATLQKSPEVVTKSEGEEPYRRVIIKLK